MSIDKLLESYKYISLYIKKILITGGDGFIASNLIKLISKKP